MFLLIVLLIAIVAFVLILKRIQVDFTLKFWEIFGKEVKDLCGKVVWITGASSGIGEYLAYELAAAGCKLVLSARRQAELERVKSKCCEIAEGKVKDFNKDSQFLVLPLDVTKFDTHQDALKTVLDFFGQVDILVNNSGRGQRSLAIETDFKVDQDMFEINVLGTISLTKVVAHYMVEKKMGHIVVVSSLAGKIGTPYSSTYSATKFALQGFFDALRIEVFDKNVKVTLVCPGPIKSGFVSNIYNKDGNDKAEALKENDSRRMDTDRFVKLMTIAVANELDEVWISTHPELVFTYLVQYLPRITRWFSKRFMMKIMNKMRQNKEKKDQ